MRERIRLQRLVERLRQRAIRDPRVLRAMGEVPRTAFVDEALHGKAYADSALPIGDKQTISQPWIVARMTELLQPQGTGRVLEVGTGSGYHAAVLSRVFEQVYSVERILGLARRAQRAVRSLGIENVHFKVFDGGYGWSEFAPYRGIVVTAACPEVPAPLLEQLASDGRLVLPLDRGKTQELVRVYKRKGKWTEDVHGSCSFVPLLGKYGRHR